MLSDSLFIETQ